MRIAVTGFVSEQAGSIPSANALLCRELLEQGHAIDFFSKPSFVDPRPAVGRHPEFRFLPVVNARADLFRARVEKVPGIGFAAGRLDAATYNRLLCKRIRHEHRERKYDLCLWMGDYARGKVPGLISVSFAQGPPGTDARSVLSRRREIQRLAGPLAALKWSMLARVRLSSLGLPSFRNSDHVIVGSQQSCRTLTQRYGIDPSRLSALPYPIDLNLFDVGSAERKCGYPVGGLKVLWLGRIVPRKRLDLFLDGAALAIRQGIDVRLSIVGKVGFIRGYDRMIREFPYPDRLEWVDAVPREDVPGLMRRHDVLAQPSGEEDFGSSVAEAQACGLPVIVGATNGNADYLCLRDIHLRDDRAETYAAALREMAIRRVEGRFGDALESRQLAEEKFKTERVADQLMEILASVARRERTPSISK